VRERTNIRHLGVGDLGPDALPFDLVVADLAFISLRTVAPALLELAAGGADLILLVKPQFEAGQVEVSREKGVIRNPGTWGHCLRRVLTAYGARGAAARDVMVSPLLGAQGNVEFLAHLVVGAIPAAAGPGDGSGGAIDRLVDGAVDEAVARRDRI
jgi:23S rRNA (cytidine1920-2'-O)/16S rRNA (cytidine1409-2'-O)-methyltransferase